MSVLRKKRFFHTTRLCVLCALLAVPVSDVHADYTAGTPGGAGKVTVDSETGDRKVEVTPPPAAQNQQQIPVYVYPQVDGVGPHPYPGPRRLPHREGR